MKKTVSINISGFVFIIDEDAYSILFEYIEKLNIKFKGTKSGKEIIADIEARIAELLQQRLIGRQVVSIDDVTEITNQLGTPDDFIEDEDNEEIIDSDDKPDKRFYRDSENRILGGVCSGLSNYFNINPTVFRIIFLISFFFYGSGTLIYIILWLVLPEAKTTSQKLEMRGEKINVKSIENSFKSEFNSVKSNFQKWRNSKGYENTKDSFDRFLKLLVSIFIILFKIFVGFMAVIFILTGLATVISLIAIPFAGNSHFFNTDVEINSFNLFEVLSIFGSKKIIITGYIGLLLTMGIPMISLIYMGIKMLMKFQARDKWFGIGLLTLWITGIFLTSFSAMQIARNYSQTSVYEETYVINSKSDTLYLEATLENELLKSTSEYDLINFDDIKILLNDNEYSFLVNPNFDIERSSSEDIELVLEYKSHGKTRKIANEYCKNINYEWQQIDSLIKFNQVFTTGDNKKWHGEILKITLKLPENKSIFLSKDMEKIIFDIDNVNNTWDYEMVGKFWTMTNRGLDDFSKILNSENNNIESNSEKTDSVLNDMQNELEQL